MKKTVFESNLSIMISLIIIIFIISISVIEFNDYNIIKLNQLFYSDINNVIDSINYLVNNNNIKGFKTLQVHIPNNNFLIFDNNSNLIKVNNNSFNLDVDLINYLNLSNGVYNIVLCYDCNVSRDYLVIFR